MSNEIPPTTPNAADAAALRAPPAFAPGAPPPAPGAPTPPPPPVESAEDIADALRGSEALSAMLMTEKKKPTPPKPGEGAPTPPKPGEGAPKPPEDATPPKRTKKPKREEPEAEPAQPQMSAEQIATLAAETAARVRPPEPTPTPGELPADLKKLVPLYETLESLKPDKYPKGLGHRIVKFREVELKRADDWEAAQRAKGVDEPVYNANDPEHADWYKQNEPVIDQEDWDEAKFEMRYKARKERDVDPEMVEAKQVVAQMKAAPAAQQATGSFAETFFRNVSAAEGELSPEVVKTFKDTNPIVAEVAQEAESALLPVVHQASMLWDGAMKFDTNNPAHRIAAENLQRMEAELAASRAPVKNEAGQTWIPLTQWTQLPPQQRARHFTTTKQGLVNYLALTTATQVKKVAGERIDRVKKDAARLGYVEKAASSETRQPDPPPAPRTHAPPPSPSVGTGGPTPPAGGVGSSKPDAKPDMLGRMLTTL